MNKSPSFQLYAQDFLTGVMFLTNEEIGMYMKMLCKQWTDGKIPKKRLGFLVGIDWKDMSDELKEKFLDMGEYLINERLERERDKKKKFLEKQSINGKKGGRPKKGPKPKLNPNNSQKKPLEEEDEEEEEKEERKRKGKLKKIMPDPKFKDQGIINQTKINIANDCLNWLVETFDFQQNERAMPDITILNDKIAKSAKSGIGENSLEAFKFFVNGLSPWIKENKFSPSYWVSKYDEIYHSLKHSKSNGKYQIDEVAREQLEIAAKAFG